MSEVKHTPGPWEYRPKEHDDWGMVRGGQTEWGLGPICQARDPRYLDEHYLAECRETGRDPWEANARLIAAAPELLTVCQMLVSSFSPDPNGPHGSYALGELYEARKAAELAIAKATGGQS